ncbi:hypothetical protein LXA43DRAFT_1067240 [Ganoderma leucocontextum]|nr:hypothetical protein LXA43DRAFT_1067240 [Ganoderma leucocontextum]
MGGSDDGGMFFVITAYPMLLLAAHPACLLRIGSLPFVAGGRATAFKRLTVVAGYVPAGHYEEIIGKGHQGGKRGQLGPESRRGFGKRGAKSNVGADSPKFPGKWELESCRVRAALTLCN